MLESLVRNCLVLPGDLCAAGVNDNKGGGEGKLGTGAYGLGILLGLSSLESSSPESELKVR